LADRSQLEMVVLGVVWKIGPCTPYTVRREFLTSPTPHFSGSSGSIYPLMRRLERQALLASDPVRQGRRGARRYRITPEGVQTLGRWLQPPLPVTDAAASHDPLRARLYFLGALPRRQRRAFLDGALERSRAQLPILQADEDRYAESRDDFSRLASRGIRQSIEARIAWLEEVRRELNRLGLV
jgi:DNA-binding PadR family transcriptional regulator